MKCSIRSINESELLDVAIDLFRQSDSYARSQPHLSRRYARQAYQLGAYTVSLRHRITQERIRMMRQANGPAASCANCGFRPDPSLVRLNDQSRLRIKLRMVKAGIVILIMLVSTLVTSVPIHEKPRDQGVTVAARAIKAPL